jgi:hypothetical protein
MICLASNQHDAKSSYTPARSSQGKMLLTERNESLYIVCEKAHAPLKHRRQLRFKLHSELATQLLQQVGLPVSQQQWVRQARGSLA